jgi:hypothetical protein
MMNFYYVVVLFCSGMHFDIHSLSIFAMHGHFFVMIVEYDLNTHVQTFNICFNVQSPHPPSPPPKQFNEEIIE